MADRSRLSDTIANLRALLECSSCKCVQANIMTNSSCEHTLCSECCINKFCPCCKQPLEVSNSVPNLFLNQVLTHIQAAVNLLHHTEIPAHDLAANAKKDNIAKDNKFRTHGSPFSSVSKSPFSSPFSTSGKSPLFKSKNKHEKRNSKGETQLQVACKKNNVKIVESILDSDTNPNTKDYAGWTPLHEAVLNNNLAIVELLLKSGALVSVPGFEQTTPLHVAVTHGFLSIVQLLLKYGADISLRDQHGKTSLDYANDNEIRNLLDNHCKNILELDESLICEKTVPPRATIIFISEDVEQNLKNKFSKFEESGDIKIVSCFSKDVSHIVIGTNENNVCKPTINILKGILLGVAIVNSDWLVDCIAENQIIDFEQYEVNGTLEHPKADGPKKARLNFMKLLPPLFEGCKIYLHNTWMGIYDKNTMTELVKYSGASLISRSPNPEYEELNKYLFHCQLGGVMEKTTTIVLYEDGNKEPRLKYNMAHIKALPLSWFLKCIETFSIIKPIF